MERYQKLVLEVKRIHSVLKVEVGNTHQEWYAWDCVYECKALVLEVKFA